MRLYTETTILRGKQFSVGICQIYSLKFTETKEIHHKKLLGENYYDVWILVNLICSFFISNKNVQLQTNKCTMVFNEFLQMFNLDENIDV